MTMVQFNLRLTITRESILRRLQNIYKFAMKDGKLHVALHAVIMQGKEINMFVKQNLPVVTRIKDMTEEQLDDFIAHLEANDPDLKGPEIPPTTAKIDKPHSHPALVHPPPPSSLNGWLEDHPPKNSLDWEDRFSIRLLLKPRILVPGQEKNCERPEFT
jgi:hypothetical protein